MRVAKNYFDKRLAYELLLDRRQISIITAAFLHEIRKALAEHGEVLLDGVGTLTVGRVGGRPVIGNLTPVNGQLRLPLPQEDQIRVSFRKSRPLCLALRKWGAKRKDIRDARRRDVEVRSG